VLRVLLQQNMHHCTAQQRPLAASLNMSAWHHQVVLLLR
jgi:hypothetical protein